MNRPSQVLIALSIAFTLSGCQGYRELATKGANAFHDIALEVSAEVGSVAKIEELKIERKAQAGSSFVVTGNVTYSQSCTSALLLGVSFVNAKAVVLYNTRAPIRSYVANTTARFQTAAHINAKIGETQDIIDKVIVTELKCV
jgi:hypothetical protein